MKNVLFALVLVLGTTTLINGATRVVMMEEAYLDT